MAEAKDDILESDEWKKAVDYAITDEDIERQMKLLGHMSPSKHREYNQTATVDNIRNWSHGCGDDNPVFCDPDYAAGTRWGGVIAPGMMIGSVNSPMKGDPTPDEIKKLRKSLFRGIHVFVSGSTWDFYRPMRPGDETRYFDDVKVGESLGNMAKGPLTVTDVICFHSGGYGFVPYAPTVGRLAHKNRKRIAPFYVKNEQGIPDVAQRLHWDPKWAQAIGNPMAYDYGVMRENYLFHYLQDWAGDDGIVTHVHDEIRKFNYMGDTQFVTGEVVGKREENGQYLVDVMVQFMNQRDEVTVKGTATIALPKKGRLAMYPEVPAELAEEAARMMARHWELSKK